MLFIRLPASSLVPRLSPRPGEPGNRESLGTRLNMCQIFSYLPAAIREFDYGISHISGQLTSNFHLIPLQHQWVLAVSQNQLNHRQLSPYYHWTHDYTTSSGSNYQCMGMIGLSTQQTDDPSNTCLEFPINFYGQMLKFYPSPHTWCHYARRLASRYSQHNDIINFQCGSFFHCFYICWGRSVCKNCGNLHTSKISFYTVQDVSKDVYLRYDIYL